MIDRAVLLSDLQRLLSKIEADLRKRASETPEFDTRFKADHAAALADKRTAAPFLEWREDLLTQVGVAWILGCVFVRFLEDNAFLDTPLLSGPGDRLRAAQDQQLLYIRDRKTDSDREYLLHVFATVGRLPALGRLYDQHNPLHLLGPSADGAQELLRFWQRIDPATGALVHDFTDATADTRFVGDLYQDLSEAARKRFALLQTPVFVEEFILDRTLEPAIQTFGLAKVRMIDPTCGSGHFLLGSFERLLARWQKAEPGTNNDELVRRALDAVHGIDLNPFAVAIARFRLLVAALRAADIPKARSAPAWPLNVFTGDALLFGPEPGQHEAGALLAEAIKGAYRTEDAEDATRVLGQRYHAVVGNPPYITVKDRAVKSAIKQRFKSCHGRWVLTLPFFERFFDLTEHGDGTERRPAGYMGQITGNSFMKREFGKKLVENFIPRWDITHIIDTSGAYLPGHGTPTVIAFGRHQRPVAATIRVVMGITGEPATPPDPAKGLVWQAILTQIDHPGSESSFVSVADTARQSFHNHPWSIGGGGAAELKSQIDEACDQTLSAATSVIGVFGMTNSDETLLAPAHAFTTRQLETEMFRPIVAGDGPRDWQIEVSENVIFPYTTTGLVDVNSKPSTLKWLWPCRTVMGNRATFSGPTYFEEGRPWWEWHQVALDRMIPPLTITFGEIATHNHFVLDHGERVFQQAAPIVKLSSSATEEDHLGLLGLLNSSTACFYLKQVCFPKGGDHQGSEGARVRTTLWDERYAFNSTQVGGLPLPSGRPLDLTRELDGVAQHLHATSPAQLIADAANLTRERLAEREQAWHTLLGRMIALQEELDWQVYALYGLLPADDLAVGDPLFSGPNLKLGQRPFEIALARKIADEEEQSEWFNRHRSTPITEIPRDWPAPSRTIAERRLHLIATDKSIGLIERPEYKRRWNLTPWVEQLTAALRTWLLDRLESLSHPTSEDPRLFSVSELAERTRADADFQRVADLYTGRPDFDLTALVADLVASESVPSLPGQRYKDTGLRKRTQWEDTWTKQRAEDAITARLTAQGLTGDALKQAIHTAVKTEIGDIPVPPKYTSADFYPGFWKLRGKLDVPKERWISYPGAERNVDPTPVLAWAGLNHLQQAQAVAALFERLKSDGASEVQLSRVLASLAELIPWLRQWHNEIDPSFGERMGDFFATFVEQEAQRLQLTAESLKEIAYSRKLPASAASPTTPEIEFTAQPRRRFLEDFTTSALPPMPKKARKKLSDDSHWLLFVHYFLQHVPDSATLPLLEKTWWVLARRNQHAADISHVLGEDAFTKWDASFKQEMPIQGFIPFVIDLSKNDWISVDPDTLHISVPPGSDLLKTPPDLWREFDVAAALKVVANQVEIPTTSAAAAEEQTPTTSSLVSAYKASFAA